MTVSTTIASQTFPGNGGQSFPCDFRIFDDTNIFVQLVKDADGTTTTLVLNTDYTVSGAGGATGFTLATTNPVAIGYTLTVERVMPYEQPTDFTNQGSFFPSMHEDMADRLEMQIQQIAGRIARSLVSNLATGNFDLAGSSITGAPDATSDTGLTTLGQVSQLVTAAAGGLTPADVALYSQLASTAIGKGSALASYIQRAVGAYGTTVENKLHWLLDLTDFIDPANWSAALAGTFDVSSALGKAIDEALLRGAAGVRLPAGALKLGSKVTKAVAGINGFVIEGAGMGATKLVCYDASGSGLDLSVSATGNWWIDISPSNTFRFAHFSICSTVLNAGDGIKISGGATSGRIPAPLVFDHVEVRQLNSINNQAFSNGVHLLDAAQSTFNNCRFFAGGTTNATGVGVLIEASAAGIDPTDHHFVNCKFVYGAAGVQAGNYIEGLWFSNCVAIGVNRAVLYSTTTGESGLCWTGGHINASVLAFDLANVFDVQITGALIYAKSGLKLNVGSNMTVVGNTFYGIDASGTAMNLLGLTGSTRGSTIDGNQFSSFTNGILIDAASHNITIGTNGFSNVATRISNASTDSYVAPRIYAGSTVKTLTGGAAFENIDLPIPSGTFAAKPVNASCQVIDPLGTDMIGFYAYNDAATTATNARFRIVRRDGANTTAGSYRFGFTMFGN